MGFLIEIFYALICGLTTFHTKIFQDFSRYNTDFGTEILCERINALFIENDGTFYSIQ